MMWVTLGLFILAIAEAPFVAMWFLRDSPAAPSALGVSVNGTVYVESEPSGAEVLVNGETMGQTPARLTLPRGPIELQLRREGVVRVVPLTVNPEETMRLRVELPPS